MGVQVTERAMNGCDDPAVCNLRIGTLEDAIADFRVEFRALDRFLRNGKLGKIEQEVAVLGVQLKDLRRAQQDSDLTVKKLIMLILTASIGGGFVTGVLIEVFRLMTGS